MENILSKIIATKQQEVANAKKLKPYGELLSEALASARPCVSLKKALVNSPAGIIAEFKRKSPSRGFIHQDARIQTIVPGYEKAGAAAVSVLTDVEWFDGSIADLAEARRLVNIPLLRKDFVMDGYQVCQAKMAGADAVLLIAAALTPEMTCSLAYLARQLGLEALLEIHGPEELRYINEYVDVIGVNNRNLHTFETDVQVSFDLAEQIPAGLVKISESGISSPSTVRKLKQAGYHGFLMGENFMKQSDPVEALHQFIEAL